MVDRLAEDHHNARRLAEGLVRLPGLRLDTSSVQSNIVVFGLDPHIDPALLIDGLRQEGLLIINLGGGRLRAVTHYGISAEDCDTAVVACQRVLDRLGAGAAGAGTAARDASGCAR
jgi:threonine aldolase